MEKLDIRKKVDISTTIMTVFFFGLGLTFSMFDFRSSYENYVMFLLLMIVCIISYYLGVTISLVVTLVVDFGYISFKIYEFFMAGTMANLETYYWVVMVAIGALVFSYFGKNLWTLQEEIGDLKSKNQNLVMIDAESGIRNIKAFMNEMPIYMSMAKRHRELPLTLMVTKIKYSENIKKILGYEKYTLLINTISKVTMESLRDEDRKYVLEEGSFAYILITDVKGADIVKNRVKKVIENIVIEKQEELDGIKVEIQAGICEWNEKINSPIEFLQLAEGEMNYDL